MLTAAIAVLTFFNAGAQEISDAARQKAEGLVKQMTLDEKLNYIGGYNGFYIRAVDRLGIPEIRMADGPQGVRNDTRSTLYPSGIVTASTWNRDLAHKVGVQLGQDCRARGVGFILGPGVNIYRSPLCGRNFEYFGEDPYLASETAVQYIEGVQQQGVIATIKHFCGNNEEWDRYDVSSEIDERTLQELYLTTFRKAVEQAHVGAIMSSYNMLNGQHTTENPHIIQDIMRGQWGFGGIYMSDWGATYTGIAAANAGLDLEMPSGMYMDPAVLKKAVADGVVDERVIDEKVQHILQTLIAFGLFDRERQDKTIPLDNPVSDEVALEVAREGVVLLKNDDNILPVDKGNYVILGPNADHVAIGGGSGTVDPLHVATFADSFQGLGKKYKTTVLTAPDGETSLSAGSFYTDKSCSAKGLKGDYFASMDLNGDPAASRVDNSIDFSWDGKASPLANIPGDKFSIRWSGVYCPLQDESVLFSLGGDDGFRMKVDGEWVIKNWSSHSFTNGKTTLDFKAGKKYEIVIEYFENTGNASVKFQYTVMTDSYKVWDKAVASADAVFFCAGLDKDIESEGVDRPYGLPADQTAMIDRISRLNKNLVVILNCGGAVDFSGWSDKAKAIVYAMYPGQEGGKALAEIVSGQVNPSGRLAYSISRRIEDEPCFDSYHETIDKKGFRDTDLKKILYSEGLFTGYRGYEKNNVSPLYPFGYGLSYTTFEYSNFKVKKDGKKGNKYVVSFDVKNTGKVAGAEVAQVYVGAVNPKVVRPAKELKGYSKIFLKKGEKQNVKIALDDESFHYYDVISKQFVVDPGDYRIFVGSSAADIELNPVTVTIEAQK